MNSEELTRFVDEVVRSHELATGLKPLESHKEIIAYARSKGFVFNQNEWNAYFERDFSQLSDSIQQKYWLLRPAIGLGRFVSSLLGELC